MENSKNYEGFYQETGNTKYKADPKSCLLEPAGPGRRAPDEHQRAQETQLERQQKQEAQFRVVGSNLQMVIGIIRLNL